jgi:AcrR family transcriptional regulator
LFAEKGYQDATLRELATRAGVAVESVFTTLESKEDVLFAIAAEGHDGFAAAIDAEAVGDLPAREKLKCGFRTAYD